VALGVGGGLSLPVVRGGVVGCVRAVGVEWWWWWVLRVLSRVVMALPDGGCVCVSGVGCLVP
jgi:hypothetical protein